MYLPKSWPAKNCFFCFRNVLETVSTKAPINVKPAAGGGRAWGGDLTFFKNLPSNSLPTGKSFQSIATKFPHPGLHIAVHPKAGPKKGTIKISPNKNLQFFFINVAATPKTLTSSHPVGSQIHPHVGRRKIQISPPPGEQD